LNNEKIAKYFKYAVVGSFVLGIGAVLGFLLGAKNITCCNFINSLKCGNEQKED